MNKQWKRAGRALIGTAFAGGVLIATGLPAAAATTRAVVLNDQGHQMGYAQVSGKRAVTVCDTVKDGVGVYGRFVYKDGSYTDVTDANGSDSGCGSATLGKDVVKFRAIARNGQESGWTTPA